MNMLAETAVSLEFNPMAFVDNLKHMGVGMLVIFVPALNASTVGIMVPVSALFTIAVARILYKKGIL